MPLSGNRSQNAEMTAWLETTRLSDARTTRSHSSAWESENRPSSVASSCTAPHSVVVTS